MSRLITTDLRTLKLEERLLNYLAGELHSAIDLIYSLVNGGVSRSEETEEYANTFEYYLGSLYMITRQTFLNSLVLQLEYASNLTTLLKLLYHQAGSI
jgi:hypothetical protein